MTDETLNQEATTEETKVEVPAHIRANFDNTVDFKGRNPFCIRAAVLAGRTDFIRRTAHLAPRLKIDASPVHPT